MALSETLTETRICNMALGRLGALRIDDVENDSSLQTIQCRLHYEQTRDALLRSHKWRFASAREELDTTDTPDFEWDYAFALPDDFLAMRSIYEDRFSDENLRTYALEGLLLLTNESSMEIRYIKKVTDVTKFDPLFVNVLTLLLADVLIGPLAGGDARIQKKIDTALDKLMPAVRALDRQETNTIGKGELETWNDARYNG